MFTCGFHLMYFVGEQKRLPQLTLFVHLKNGAVVDATLSPETRKCLETLAVKQQGVAGIVPSGNDNANQPENLPVQDDASQMSSVTLLHSILVTSLSNFSQV